MEEVNKPNKVSQRYYQIVDWDLSEREISEDGGKEMGWETNFTYNWRREKYEINLCFFSEDVECINSALLSLDSDILSKDDIEHIADGVEESGFITVFGVTKNGIDYMLSAYYK